MDPGLVIGLFWEPYRWSRDSAWFFGAEGMLRCRTSFQEEFVPTPDGADQQGAESGGEEGGQVECCRSLVHHDFGTHEGTNSGILRGEQVFRIEEGECCI